MDSQRIIARKTRENRIELYLEKHTYRDRYNLMRVAYIVCSELVCEDIYQVFDNEKDARAVYDSIN